MDIDNSAARTFMRCPAMWQERYLNKIESVAPKPELEFGKRIHQLLEAHFGGRAAPPARVVDTDEAVIQQEETGLPLPPLNEALEAEAQQMYSAYRAFYPQEDFEVVAVEELIRVPLNLCAECKGIGHGPQDVYSPIYGRPLCQTCKGFGVIDYYTGKLDIVGRWNDTGHLFIMDHKSEKRNGQGNTPQIWKNRAQVGLYQWAAQQRFGEPIQSIVIDILTRRSPAGRMGPEFRRMFAQRTEWQCEEAVETLRWIVKQMKLCVKNAENAQNPAEFRLFPTNREECKWCPYESLHGENGRDPETLRIKFKAAEEYLL